MRQLFISLMCSVALCCGAHTVSDFVCEQGGAGDFPVVSAQGVTATLRYDKGECAGVVRAIGDLQADIERVTGKRPATGKRSQHEIVIGTLGRSAAIDRLARAGKIPADSLRGKWESFVIATVGQQLVIAGSDRRGTIYGIYELSEQLGVSPWYWWADVPVRHRAAAYVRAGCYASGEPKVKYRGIFINDEWPSFGGWASKHFGGVNSKMYAHMFELLLRLKANYLWPAMWSSAFNEDDPESPRLADEYGIVMGTSHHEPMMRAHQEYVRRKKEIGPWDYATNKERVDSFFRFGMERNKGYDNLVTIGMRGDGDTAMGRGDDADNIRTLGNVIKGQREIIKDIYGRPDAVPQLWAIFTEVQRYYDAGFNVPDDVTLLFCDNNWGYIRRTAPAAERTRKGGMGLYYHIDMNGGPWNDRWVNTSPLPKLREQLSLAYRSGLDRIWIINVGDLKPKEVPIDFIMSYAWNPDAVQPGDERTWLRRWAAQGFGCDVADDVADIIARYAKYNLWRKPEVQTADIVSVENYHEADSIALLWRQLAEKAEAVRLRIPAEAQDAYYQLVYYPAVASAGVAEIYTAAACNRYYAERGDRRANAYADRAKELFRRDSLMTEYYNKEMAHGKWDGMMQDRHIGYIRWAMPDRNVLPELRYVAGDVAGDVAFLPRAGGVGFCPHAGRLGFCPSALTGKDISCANGARGRKPTCPARGKNATSPARGKNATSSYAIAATHYTRAIPFGASAWRVLPDLGRADGCMGADDNRGKGGARLEYDITTDADSVVIALAILPTQDVQPERGLRLAVAIDGQEPIVLDARRGLHDEFREYTPQALARSKKMHPLPPPVNLTLAGTGRDRRNEVFDNQRWLTATFRSLPPGRHTLAVVMVDPEVVLERIVVNPDNAKYSYFGPPAR